MNIQIQTISSCSGRCQICPYISSWHHKNPGKMDNDTYEYIISEISALNINKLCLYLQNEPFLDPLLKYRINDLIVNRNSGNINYKLLELSTNLSPLNRRKIYDFAELLTGTPHELWVSFHGVDKTSYEAIMGIAFDKGIENLLTLVGAMQEYDLNVVVRGTGEPLIRTDKTPVWFGEAQYRAFMDDILRGFERKPRIDYFKYHDRAGNSKIKFGYKNNGKINCPRPNNWIHFLWDGSMILCCMDYHKETVFGNSENGIEQALECGKFKSLKKMCFGQIESPSNFICKRCYSPGG